MTFRSRVLRALAPLALAAGLSAVSAGCASVAPPEAHEPIAIDGEADALHGKRYLEIRVGINVAASPDVIWALLTDAERYPAWNSTVTSIEGTIAEGESIDLVAQIDPKRTFTLEISEFEPGRKLVWQDGGRSFKGVRTFTLIPREDGTTDFTMREVFTGTMMGMIEGSLPDFRPSFNQFAADLKAEAEQA